MEIFEMTERNEDALVLGVSRSFVESVLMNGVFASEEDSTEKMEKALRLIQEHAYMLPHAEAEEDDTFLQLVPCVMVQAIPTRMIRVAGSSAPGCDGRIMSICAHDHIYEDGKLLQDTVDSIVRHQLDIAPSQVLHRVLIGVSAPPDKPANDKHLLLMCAYWIIDFLEQNEDFNDVDLKWMNVDDLMTEQAYESLAPWSRFAAPYLLPLADAAVRDITIHFFMEDGVQALEFKENAREEDHVCAEQ